MPAGEDEAEQLACVMEVLGVPPADLVERATRRKLFFDSAGAPRLSPNSQGKLHHPGERAGGDRGRSSGGLWAVLYRVHAWGAGATLASNLHTPYPVHAVPLVPHTFATL